MPLERVASSPPQASTPRPVKKLDASSDNELAIEKEKAYLKWCDEHPDELEKRCLEHYPKLEIGGTKATMDISDELWDAYEREVEAEWLEANARSDWREKVREVERQYFGY